MFTDYTACCDRLPGNCICAAEAAYCSDCGEALPDGEADGEGVQRGAHVLCRSCNNDACEEEVTRC
jgi:hypothetical protein